MSDPNPAQATAPKRSLFRWLLIIGVPLAFGILFLNFCTSSPVDRLLWQESKLQILSQALQRYSEYNDGKYPEELADLVPECLKEDQTQALKFTLRRDHPEDWSYFPGFTTSDPPDTILVASPSTFSCLDGTRRVGWGAFRLVLSLDGMQTLLKEADYQACLIEQQKSDWQNHDRPATHDVWQFLTSPDWRARAENSDTRNNPSPPRQVPGPAEIQAQLDLLSDPEAGYSAAHKLAIMSLANESIVPALINLLQPGSDQVPTKAYWALVALRKIGLSNAKAAIPAVIGTLAGDEDLRWEAIKVLAGAGAEAKTAIPQLIEVAANGKYADSQWAIITLGRIGPPARDAVPALTAMFDGDHRYKIDVARALWIIDSAQATKLIPEIIWEIERQRNASGPNQQMSSEFFSSIELLGEIGPEAKSAIPALRMQLQGGARFHAAWSLWRIDPTLTDVVTPVLAGFLDQPAARDNRLDRLAVRQRWRVRAHTVPFDRKAAAVGALWQIHSDKRRELESVLLSLLLDWEKEKVLNEWTAETLALIPALEDLLKNSTPDRMKWIILEAFQEINSTDPGSNH